MFILKTVNYHLFKSRLVAPRDILEPVVFWYLTTNSPSQPPPFVVVTDMQVS